MKSACLHPSTPVAIFWERWNGTFPTPRARGQSVLRLLFLAHVANQSLKMKDLCTDFAIHEPKSVYDNIVLSVGAIHFGYTWVGRMVEIRALMPKVSSSFFLNEFIRWSPQKCLVSLCVTRDIRVSCTQGTQSIESGIQTHVFQDERLPDDLRQKISPLMVTCENLTIFPSPHGSAPRTRRAYRWRSHHLWVLHGGTNAATLTPRNPEKLSTKN